VTAHADARASRLAPWGAQPPKTALECRRLPPRPRLAAAALADAANQLHAPQPQAAPPIPPAPSFFTGHGESGRNGDVRAPTTAKPRGDLRGHGSGRARYARVGATLLSTPCSRAPRHPSRRPDVQHRLQESEWQQATAKMERVGLPTYRSGPGDSVEPAEYRVWAPAPDHVRPVDGVSYDAVSISVASLGGR
jgi:hypothetical protein